MPDGHTNSHVISLPTFFLYKYYVARGLTSFRYATHTMHVITLPSCMPPTQSTRYLRQGHLHPVYQVHFLLYLFLKSDFRCCIVMSKRVFKSISKNVDFFAYLGGQDFPHHNYTRYLSRVVGYCPLF